MFIVIFLNYFFKISTKFDNFIHMDFQLAQEGQYRNLLSDIWKQVKLDTKVLFEI